MTDYRRKGEASPHPSFSNEESPRPGAATYGYQGAKSKGYKAYPGGAGGGPGKGGGSGKGGGPGRNASSGGPNVSSGGPGKNQKKKGGPWRFVFWVALIVFIVSLIALGVIGYSYWKSQDVYNNIAAEAFNPDDFDSKSLADMTIDWDALRAQNPDTVGWIYIPGSNVNYPIVHTTDNDKYLSTNFLGTQDWTTAAGAIFLSAENTPDFSDANNIVYGHHMRDGSMFAFFATLQDRPLFNANRKIYILTPQGNYLLETFSIFVCNANDPLGQVSFASNEELQSYVQDKMNRTTVTPDPNEIDAATISQVFTFITCTGGNADDRVVTFAQPIETTTAESVGEGSSAVDPQDVENVDEATKEAA